MKMDLKQLDEFSMRFENEWTPNQPLAYPFQFFQAEKPVFGEEGEILAEICMIDMQRRWKEWGSRNLAELSAPVVLNSFSQLPKCEDYIDGASKCGVAFTSKDVAELKSVEFLARQKYGDLPTRDSADSDVQLPAARKINRPRVSVVRLGQVVFECETWGKFEVGRQAKGEPEFPCFIENVAIPKLLCAEGMDASISRNQFEVSLVSRRFAIVANTSSNRSFLVDDRLPLLPQVKGVAKLPFEVKLGDTIVRFERRS